MKTKNMDRDTTIKAIELLKLRLEFNNKLNKFVRKYMKIHDPKNTFNGWHDAPTDDMKTQLLNLLNQEDWMPNVVKCSYFGSCAAIFGQTYGPHVNRYILTDLHDCEKHLEEIEKATVIGREENSEFKVVRDLSNNRMNIYFDDIPEQEVRKCLKKNGFRWAPHYNCWTRQLTQEAEKSLERIKAQMQL